MRQNSHFCTTCLSGEVDEFVPGDGSTFVGLQTTEQRAAGHQFGDDEYRLVARADGVERHEARVLQLLHDGRLLEELGRRHGARLERLHRHRRALVPHAYHPPTQPVPKSAIDAAALGPFKK